MCYYTITTDIQNKDGHTQSIMILDAKDKMDATAKFLNTFGPQYYNDLNVVEGIHIADGFADLVTTPIKKLIMKYKSGNSDVSLVSYCNSIHTKYNEE